VSLNRLQPGHEPRPDGLEGTERRCLHGQVVEAAPSEHRRLMVGLGGAWHSKEAYFSGVTHGGQQVEQNAAGQPIVVYSPQRLTLNAMAKYEWKHGKHSQYVQINIDNLLDDTKEYGLIYSTPMTARLSYGMGF